MLNPPVIKVRMSYRPCLCDSTLLTARPQPTQPSGNAD